MPDPKLDVQLRAADIRAKSRERQPGSAIAMTERMIRSRKREWGVPAALIALCAIPLAAGAVRLLSLGAGTEITPENARFFAAPVPVVETAVAAVPQVPERVCLIYL